MSLDDAPLSQQRVFLAQVCKALADAWKTDVLNKLGAIWCHALAQVGYSFTKCVTYAPMLSLNRATCVWVMEFEDSFAKGLLGEQCLAKNEVPSIAVQLKMVVQDQMESGAAFEGDNRFSCSLIINTPNFWGQTAATGSPWLEHLIMTEQVQPDEHMAGVLAQIQTLFTKAVNNSSLMQRQDEAQAAVNQLLRDMAP